jgi:hypothetical protein
MRAEFCLWTSTWFVKKFLEKLQFLVQRLSDHRLHRVDLVSSINTKWIYGSIPRFALSLGLILRLKAEVF